MGLFKRFPILSLLAAILAYFALWLLVPRATFLPVIVNVIGAILPFTHGNLAFSLTMLTALVFFAPTAAFMAIQIAIVYFFAKIRMNVLQTLATLIFSLAGIVGILAIAIRQSDIAAKIGHYPTFNEQMTIMSVYYGPGKIPIVLLTMFAAASIGYMVSLLVKDKNLILPIVMFAAYIDFWTVTRGPVATMLKKTPRVVEAVSAPIPQVGTGTFVPHTMIGPGDFLFMALVFAAVHRLRMNAVRNYWFVFVAMTIGMLAVMVGIIHALPALIVLAVAVVAANWREFKLTKQEAISVTIVAAILLASLPLIWSVLKPQAEKKISKPKTHIAAPKENKRDAR